MKGTGSTFVILGATGLVGQALVEQLAADDPAANIVSLTRRPALQVGPRITNHIVDFERLEDSAELIRGDVFFSTLGTTRKQAGSVHAQRRVDLDYQLAAARIAAHNGIRHYALLSSSFADASSANAYRRMKGELETAVLALPFERVSIFRPFVLTGDRDVTRPLEACAGRLFGWFSRTFQLPRIRPVSARQVATKMIEAISQPGPPRQIIMPDQMG